MVILIELNICLNVVPIVFVGFIAFKVINFEDQKPLANDLDVFGCISNGSKIIFSLIPLIDCFLLFYTTFNCNFFPVECHHFPQRCSVHYFV